MKGSLFQMPLSRAPTDRSRPLEEGVSGRALLSPAELREMSDMSASSTDEANAGEASERH